MLSTKHVCVIGCGSVGSAVAEMLVRTGVGALTLIDPEALAPENLGRHLLSRQDLGSPKVKGMQKRLAGINTECTITARAVDFAECLPTASVFGGSGDPKRFSEKPVDLFVSTVDSFRCHSMVNGLSLHEQIPAIYVGCWGPAKVGEILTVIPSRTPCYECFAAFRQRIEIPVDERRYTDASIDETRMPGQEGLWANILVVAGIAFQAMLGVFQLRPVLDEHTLWLFNLYDESLTPFALTRATVQKGCAICDESKVEALSL